MVLGKIEINTALYPRLIETRRWHLGHEKLACKLSAFSANLTPMGLRDSLKWRWDQFTLPFQSKIQSVKIGGNEIKLDRANPMRWHYKEHPNMGEYLAHLAQAVEKNHSTGCIVDIGANVGDTAAWLRSQSSLPILCVEGDEASYFFLSENLSSWKNVHLLRQFLGEQNETIDVNIGRKGWNNILLPPDRLQSTETVELRTLDTVLTASPLADRPVKLIKVDTEGYDLRILRGAQKTLEIDRPVLTFELSSENLLALHESVDSFYDFLRNLDYSTYLFFDNLGRFLCYLEEPDKEQWLDLYRYSLKGLIPYFDLCAFHRSEHPWVNSYVQTVRQTTIKI